MNKLFLLLIGCLVSCSTWKKKIIDIGGVNEAIINAIIDFHHSEMRFKRGKRIAVYLCDDKPNQIVLCMVDEPSNKLFPDESVKIGSYDDFFPNEYKIYKGNIYYWNVGSKILTYDVVKALSTFNAIDSLNVEKFKYLPPLLTDDAKKGVDYFFCKGSLRNYKKVKTSTAYGYYSEPKIDCN